MVAFINGKDEKRVALVNSIRSQPVEELSKCLIVGLKLSRVTGFAGTEREVNVSGGAVVIVRIGDVGICDRNAGLLHLRDPGERNCSLHAIKARKADVSGCVLDHVAVEIGHGSTWLDDRVDVQGAEKTVEITVTAGLIWQ